jgi:CO dehydrogenase maturation factor
MTTTMAVAGKGGTGKTTVAALLIRYLVQNHMGSVLAIDADPSSNLNLALGVELEQTIGAVREEALTKVQAGNMGSGITKTDFLEYGVRDALVEEKGFDLLAMGRPEGQGCYCAANSILRNSMDRLSLGYDYVVMDNEAGLEHISRRTTRDVDILLIVSDFSQRGIVAAGRVAELTKELKTKVKRMGLVLNRAHGWTADTLPAEVAATVQSTGIPLLAVLPDDPLLGEYDIFGKPLWNLPAESVAWQTLSRMFATVLQPAV